MKANRIVTLAMTLCAASVSQGQAWNAVPGGNVIGSTEYLGARAGSTVPLRFTTIPNLGMEWRTNNVLRMRLTQTLTGQTVNGYGNRDLSGHLGIGLFTDPDVNRPFSMLHIDSAGQLDTGYRLWMKVGMTLTRESDLSYFGLKGEDNDVNHAVIAWSDNTPGVHGPDLLKFIFLRDNVGGTTAASLNGLESARFLPHVSGNESFFGVGDWFTAGLNPTERVDLLDGRFRIRQLPDDQETDQAFKVMVVDDTNDPNERGVVKWRNVNLNADCDWVEQNPEPHISSVYNNSNCAWDLRHGVGVGVPVPKTKLHVFHDRNDFLSPTAIMADARFDLIDAQPLFGLYAQARPSTSTTTIQSQQATGAFGQAINSRVSVGVHGFGSTCTATDGTAGDVIGV